MLRQESSRYDPPEQNKPPNPTESFNPGSGDIDIQGQFNYIEDIIFDSPHIPFTRRTLIDEELLLAQLDLVRENLPLAFQQATRIIEEHDAIIQQAEQYAQEIIETAQRRAEMILDELGIIQQAEHEAQQISQQVQKECEAMHKQTVSELEQMRRKAQQELEQMRQMTLAECEEIQNGADAYADGVLYNIEQHLSDMLRVIRNGRQQLNGPVKPQNSGKKDNGKKDNGKKDNGKGGSRSPKTPSKSKKG
ncbi:ATP synthase F0 subunit B [Moorena bouillonii]|uniref:ATP synthase F0 subunit B n=1 Tax=Moorena bouillonii TaxID=207920 RepID=UPI001E53D186|nr:ATP synthase F0 subunit B [Moorena bouillonii]